ncbi:MAG: O-antigen ligase domain-containing protein [Anaerolineales bacterium]|nr:MAG: O-antigen ligase domain-containing protein [Anaerolineales bacterium]
MTMNATARFARRATVVFVWGRGWPRFGLRLAFSLLGLVLLGIFLARAPLGLCVAVVAGAIGCFLLLLRPSVALYALAFAVPFGSVREFNLGGMTIGASQFLILGLAVAWVLRMAAFRQIRVVRSPVTAGLLCYLGTMVVSAWVARDLIPAAKELLKWGELLLLCLFVAGELGERERRALVVSLLLAGILQGALGVYQFLHQVGPPAFVLLGRYVRAHGTFLQPNPFGGYMGLLLPLAYGMVLSLGSEALTAQRGRGPWPVLLWALAVLASAVMLAALVMSWSRGALLGLAFGVGLVALAMSRRVWPVVAIIALGFVLLVPGIGPAALTGLPGGLLERLTDVTQYVGISDLTAIEITDDNYSAIERLAHWDAAWRMFAGRPWLGGGTGGYASVYPSVALPRWEDALGHAHNYYLNALAEGGLMGLFGYLIFVATALLVAWRAARKERGWRRGLALGALGMLGHLLGHSVFDNLYVHEMYLVVGMLLGMVASRSGETSPLPASERTRLQVP